jgi:hypothetical protein
LSRISKKGCLCIQTLAVAIHCHHKDQVMIKMINNSTEYLMDKMPFMET